MIQDHLCFAKPPPKHLPLVQLPVHGRSVFEDSADALVLDIATFEAEAVAWSNFLLASCFMMVFLFAGLVQYLSALSFFLNKDSLNAWSVFFGMFDFQMTDPDFFSGRCAKATIRS